MDRTEAIIFQHLYCPGIRNTVQKEGTNCDTRQCTKRSNIKYGKFSAREAEQTKWKKLCVDIIGPYVTIMKGHKEKLNIKAVTMIDPVPGWFGIMKYYYKRVISIANLVKKVWWTRYPRPMETTYDQGSEFIGHECQKSLIET